MSSVVEEFLPGLLPRCAIRVGLGGGTVVGVLGVLLVLLLSFFSFGSFVLAVEVSFLVTCLVVTAPRPP